MLITVSPGPDNLMVLSIGASRAYTWHGLWPGLRHRVPQPYPCSRTGAERPDPRTRVSPLPSQVLGGPFTIYMGWHALESRGGAQ